MQKEVNTKVPAVRTQYEIFLKAVNRKKDVLYFSHTGGGSIIFYEQMKARYEFLEEKMKSLEKELEQFPKGKLRICRNGGKYRWLYTKESGTPPEVISQHDEFFAKQMAKKQYAAIAKSLGVSELIIGLTIAYDVYSERLSAKGSDVITEFGRLPLVFRYVLYVAIGVMIIVLRVHVGAGAEFIYLKF